MTPGSEPVNSTRLAFAAASRRAARFSRARFAKAQLAEALFPMETIQAALT